MEKPVTYPLLKRDYFSDKEGFTAIVTQIPILPEVAYLHYEVLDSFRFFLTIECLVSNAALTVRFISSMNFR